ncbi:hypothetical protein C8R41DRAFT_815269 [Lentinula lateritia]|uniref:Uncharacterized protein n=1 Tax=Lentinula lateritia TaxID=40482 RepID=A0ABQ8VSI5_9AGAR|nr:hypothetical protein C8R41DRAFT_815269 [Lentinula lateritia]
MPPRPKPIPLPRKQSNASKDASSVKVTKTEKYSKAMPPPPVPAAPMGILEPEINALSGCLQNAAVKTAQIVQFHHDARQLNVRRHAPDPPRSLQASLGRELEKYDQLCDAIETHLVRAISVLQRDLKKEQQRIRDEERIAAEAAAAAAAKAEAEAAANAQNVSMSPHIPPSGSEESVNPISGTSTPIASTNQSPVAHATVGGRRPSAISISSLNRPVFPLKLDLSSQSLRMSAEDAVSFLPPGLRSPVTLAPKSARPIDYDIMAAFNDPRVDIDLTLTPAGSSSGMNLDLDSALGSSADKPIDLDMDGMDLDQAMSDLFGDSSEADNTDANADGGDLFSPHLGTTGEIGNSANKVDANFLSSIGVGGDSSNADIFASFGVGEGGDLTSHSGTMSLPSTETLTAPSPGTLLASLSQLSTNTSHTQGLTMDESFDLGNLENLEFLSTENNDVNPDSLSWMDTTDGNNDVTDGNPTTSTS